MGIIQLGTGTTDGGLQTPLCARDVSCFQGGVVFFCVCFQRGVLCAFLWCFRSFYSTTMLLNTYHIYYCRYCMGITKDETTTTLLTAHSLLITHGYSPLTTHHTHHSPALTTHHSPLSPLRSPLTTHHTHHSLPTHSLVEVHKV